jgi:uncharacterized OB-fold protein
MDRPVPEPTPVSAPFWAALREHRLSLQYSPSADRYVYYPRILAPGTLADDLEWRDVSGRGVVYTFTVATRPTAPMWADAVPQLLAVVELEEGPRVPTELVGVAPEDIRVGLPVRAVFEDVPGEAVTMLRFTPES